MEEGLKQGRGMRRGNWGGEVKVGEGEEGEEEVDNCKLDRLWKTKRKAY